uniref:phage tail tube protein n=1 Tax=Brucella pseudintermedia TaxID=370111 RepID=UPI00158B39D6|nr:phage tail tube protein [Brucella pseudintermedia]
MAKPTTARFGKMIVSLGTVASGGAINYAAPCGFTSKSLNLSNNLTDIEIPDCDNPDDPFWVARDIQSMTAQISGEGVLAAEAIPTWSAARQNMDGVPVQVEVIFSSGTLVYEGYFKFESFEIGAENGGRVTVSVSLQSDGEVTETWTPAGS